MRTTTRPSAGGPSGAVYRTRGLGARAELVVTDPHALVAAARLLDEGIERIDRVASRFRVDAELTALNSDPERTVPVSPALLRAVAVAIGAARMTDGAVDPTVGAAVCRLGYDRDFAQIAAGVAGEVPGPEPVPGWERVELDRAAGTITRDPGVLLDLGATAKALAADLIAAEIASELGCGALVALGGDVAAAGPPPPGGFAVGLPDGAGAVAVETGGLATSGVTGRRWTLGGRPVHHLVDPATGLPVNACWRVVTVAAGSCVDANAASTAAVVKGPEAPSWLDGLGLPARLVAVDGSAVHVGGWPEEGRDQLEAQR